MVGPMRAMRAPGRVTLRKGIRLIALAAPAIPQRRRQVRPVASAVPVLAADPMPGRMRLRLGILGAVFLLSISGAGVPRALSDPPVPRSFTVYFERTPMLSVKVVVSGNK